MLRRLEILNKAKILSHNVTNFVLNHVGLGKYTNNKITSIASDNNRRSNLSNISS